MMWPWSKILARRAGLALGKLWAEKERKYNLTQMRHVLMRTTARLMIKAFMATMNGDKARADRLSKMIVESMNWYWMARRLG